MIHANVAINSSYAAHIAQRPSVGQSARAEFKCAARHGAARSRLTPEKSQRCWTEVQLQQQPTDFLC